MPNYDDLRTYFETSPDLQEAAKRASTVPIVSGFVLDVNPVWSFFYDIENHLSLPPQSFSFGFGHGYVQSSTDFSWILAGNFQDFNPTWISPGYQGYRRRNLYSPVKLWQQALSPFKPMKRFLPVTLTIVHRPLRAPEEAEMKPDDQEQLTQLVALLTEFPVALRVEERPPARFAHTAGYGITAAGGKSGTLGGVVKDLVNQTSYGVTCDHVASFGTSIQDASGTIIGQCSASTVRVALRAATVCDPVDLVAPSPFPSNGPDLNMLDCALVKLSASTSCLQVTGVAKNLSPGQDVALHGAATQRTRYKLGSLCLSYSFKEGTQNFCFRDSIELLPQSRSPFGGALGSMMATVPTQGDSGGWVLTDDQPPRWAGLFFGEDGSRGFAIRASWVHDWAEKTVGQSLTF
jgi:hypothetical protein